MYQVVRPFRVNRCTAGPAFGHMGGAEQFRLTQTSIDDPEGQGITLKTNIATASGGEETGFAPSVQEMIDLGYLNVVASNLNSKYTQPTSFPVFE